MKLENLKDEDRWLVCVCGWLGCVWMAGVSRRTEKKTQEQMIELKVKTRSWIGSGHVVFVGSSDVPF